MFAVDYEVGRNLGRPRFDSFWEFVVERMISQGYFQIFGSIMISMFHGYSD